MADNKTGVLYDEGKDRKWTVLQVPMVVARRNVEWDFGVPEHCVPHDISLSVNISPALMEEG